MAPHLFTREDDDEGWQKIQDSVQAVVTSRYWLRRQVAPGGWSSTDPALVPPTTSTSCLRSFDVIVNDSTCRWKARFRHYGEIRLLKDDWRCRRCDNFNFSGRMSCKRCGLALDRTRRLPDSVIAERMEREGRGATGRAASRGRSPHPASGGSTAPGAAPASRDSWSGQSEEWAWQSSGSGDGWLAGWQQSP